MALEFNGLEPVTFGGKECKIEINAETKLRLSTIKKYDDEADAAMAAAFPNDEAYVKDFLKNRMSSMEKELLHAYLMGGETMVKTVMGKVDGLLDGLVVKVSEANDE